MVPPVLPRSREQTLVEVSALVLDACPATYGGGVLADACCVCVCGRQDKIMLLAKSEAAAALGVMKPGISG
ncbi:hypothetical protein OPV22_006655 [Ensete ventricosum]|uniref:Uncharacterized protein n=1 Tax=Ensete ventricosum TaxID=4639 RepID=A0AAV8RQ50_ENSVE|nr:hypothetical protein OPV22_006655 [Ensete ventricosum]